MTQNLVNSFITFASILPIAIDVFLVYRLFRFFPFTSAATFGLAPYIVLTISSLSGPFFASIISIAFIFLFSLILGTFFTKKFLAHSSSSLQFFLISLGIMVLLQNILSIIFGKQPLPLLLFIADKISITSKFAIIGGIRTCMLIWASVTLVLFILIYKYTRLGLDWRAIANDPELSEIIGIKRTRALLFAFCLGAIFTSGAGILAAADAAMNPYMGLRPFMLSVVIVVVGGRNIFGVSIACLLLSTAQNFGGVLLGNIWQDVIIFMLLLIFLIFKPQGIMSTSDR